MVDTHYDNNKIIRLIILLIVDAIDSLVIVTVRPTTIKLKPLFINNLQGFFMQV